MKTCPTCPGIELKPWSPSVFVLVCPCCSSRYQPGTLALLHAGSHNDYATYLCGAE